MNECFHMSSVFQWSQSRPLDNSGIGGRSNVIWNENWIQWMLAPAAKSSMRCRHVHIEVCCWPRCTLCPSPAPWSSKCQLVFLAFSNRGLIAFRQMNIFCCCCFYGSHAAFSRIFLRRILLKKKPHVVRRHKCVACFWGRFVLLKSKK